MNVNRGILIQISLIKFFIANNVMKIVLYVKAFKSACNVYYNKLNQIKKDSVNVRYKILFSTKIEQNVFV